MINLNDTSAIQQLDPHNYFTHIYAMPEKLLAGWEQGLGLPLAEMRQLRQVVICAAGSSAFSADLLRAYLAPTCGLPLTVHRDYLLPAWAAGSETLVIALSYAGNTEEVLSASRQAAERGCRLLVITTGGRLAEFAGASDAFLWRFEADGQARTAAARQFGLLLAAMFRLGLAGDPTADLLEAAQVMRDSQANLLPEVPLARNPAKRLAGQMVGRLVAVFAADYLVPVGARLKSQVAETAKAWSQFEALPEMNHNTLAGLNHPESILTQTIALFLVGPGCHPRNQQRLNLTRQVYMTQGVNTDTITARGSGVLAQMWSAALFADYTACYLAVANGEDPSQAGILALFQEALNEDG